VAALTELLGAYNCGVPTRTLDDLDAVRHFPEGSTLVLRDVSWDDYERLAESLAKGFHRRVSYDRGRLEIMTPLPEHATSARLIDALVRVYAEEGGFDVENYGSSTWKRRSLSKGVEPDSCYYVSNAGRIVGKRHRIDLESDPPPDVVVEVDLTNESLGKFAIYAALLVPEIWRYDTVSVQFYVLGDQEYHRAVESQSFPGLTPAMLATALEHSQTGGQSAALRAFRERVKPPSR
jgi:Uma2 family endonuclease